MAERTDPFAGAPRPGTGQHNTNGKAGGHPYASISYSPLADPEFFTNADIRNYCERARGEFLKLSFEVAMAAEVLQAVLKEIPDPEARLFGSQARARRVARHLKRTATEARDAAKNAARTYAAFQREFDPELSATARSRPTRARRRFDFGL
ncbi:plasmid transfer protein TraA [Streptosporangium sp. NPDC000563]|uniref:plasmid transfer protein TraA n=1 Tax=Streptosporangium sp. NPDC000563 TaxID=3154366 RepID=UPI00331CEAE5